MKDRQISKETRVLLLHDMQEKYFAIEIREGIIVHVAEKDDIVGIEILSASERFPIRTLKTLKCAP
jgi:uncharacterized protein YuzE